MGNTALHQKDLVFD